DCLVLPEDHEFQIALEISQHLAIRGRNTLRGNPRHARYDVLDVTNLDDRLTLGDGLEALTSARLVHHVDGLVGHVPLVDVPRSELGGGFQRVDRVSDAVM